MIRTVRTLAWLLLLVSANLRADDSRPPDPHLRSGEPAIVAAIATATSLSPTFHGLVERLNRSDVVVYLSFEGWPGRDLAGRTTFMSAVGGRRYIRIAIDRRYAGCQRLAILGHELRHAVEIADAASVRDNASLESLYRRIGFRSDRDRETRFDSDAAIDAGHQVEREVRR